MDSFELSQTNVNVGCMCGTRVLDCTLLLSVINEVDRHLPISRYFGESTADIRQLAKVIRVYWRKYNGHSPIGESHESILAKVQWTFAIGECPIGERLIGEIRVSLFFRYISFGYFIIFG
jgi:hypothetical protein